MNWIFKSVPIPVPGVREFVGLYRDLLKEGIEYWLANFKPEVEKQLDSSFAEFPEGFFRNEATDPFAYRYTFTTGFYFKSKYYRFGQVPYDITIVRATADDFVSEAGPDVKMPNMRYRLIEKAESIS